jgi:hypothetical protein
MTTLSTEVRGKSRAAPIRFDAAVDAANVLTRMCSWCKDVETPRGEGRHSRLQIGDWRLHGLTTADRRLGF